jgi:hypothetical protein
MPTNGSQSFSAPYDRTSKIITAVVCVILAVVPISTKIFALSALGWLLVAVCYAYSPLGYTVSDRSIFVRRLIGRVRIPLEGVREVRRATPDDFRGCLRLWGSGGFFGYYGLFRTSKLGKCTWYVTNRAKAVVLITDTKTTLFSPDDVDDFLTAVRAEVPVPEMAGGSLAGTVEPRGGGLAWLGAAVGVVVIGIVTFAFSYAPGPPGLTLTTDSLAIHDRFYPVTLGAASVDVAHIRAVDLAVDKEWRPTKKTDGFANSHYRSGWFQVANGQKIRLYEADGKRLVLLPPNGDGAAVLVEVREPDRFVEEVQRAWAGSLKAASAGGN